VFKDPEGNIMGLHQPGAQMAKGGAKKKASAKKAKKKRR
jgi:hypothetical protein